MMDAYHCHKVPLRKYCTEDPPEVEQTFSWYDEVAVGVPEQLGEEKKVSTMVRYPPDVVERDEDVVKG